MQQMHQSTAKEQFHIHKYIFSIPNETILSLKETDVMAKLSSFRTDSFRQFKPF